MVWPLCPLLPLCPPNSLLNGSNRSPFRPAAMATLTMQPIGTNPTAQEDAKGMQKPADGADLSDIDSEWVVLEKSDICPAGLGAAAGGGVRLGFSPLPMMPIWAQWMLGGIVYMAVPFYKRARKVEGEGLENAETAVEVVEHVAEVTEKLAANVADALPESGSLQQAAVKVEYFAEEVDKDAQKVETIIKKIDEVSDEIDAAVEPVIEELEKEFKQKQTSNGGSNAQK